MIRNFAWTSGFVKLVLLLENGWAEKNIEFDMELSKQIYYGSEQLLYQVWINILDNAIKHSPVGGVIQINIRQTRYHAYCYYCRSR